MDNENADDSTDEKEFIMTWRGEDVICKDISPY